MQAFGENHRKSSLLTAASLRMLTKLTTKSLLALQDHKVEGALITPITEPLHNKTHHYSESHIGLCATIKDQKLLNLTPL
jgi:hypothetical protein